MPSWTQGPGGTTVPRRTAHGNPIVTGKRQDAMGWPPVAEDRSWQGTANQQSIQNNMAGMQPVQRAKAVGVT